MKVKQTLILTAIAISTNLFAGDVLNQQQITRTDAGEKIVELYQEKKLVLNRETGAMEEKEFDRERFIGHKGAKLEVLRVFFTSETQITMEVFAQEIFQKARKDAREKNVADSNIGFITNIIDSTQSWFDDDSIVENYEHISINFDNSLKANYVKRLIENANYNFQFKYTVSGDEAERKTRGTVSFPDREDLETTSTEISRMLEARDITFVPADYFYDLNFPDDKEVNLAEFLKTHQGWKLD